MTGLKRSTDRKVSTSNIQRGKSWVPVIANTFGLPAGKEYSCPGETRVCGDICYAAKLEKVYKGVLQVLLHNWELLQACDNDVDSIYDLLDKMLNHYSAECEAYNQAKQFRIHWDGDFYSPEYAKAWRRAIDNHPDIQFWAYTRVAVVIPILIGADNLSLYFSADEANIRVAMAMQRTYGVKLAYLADTFEQGKEILQELGTRAVRCPENNGAIPLNAAIGACITCGFCTNNRGNVLFSKKKTKYKPKQSKP